MWQAAILAVGSEIVSGVVQDTNSSYLAKHLARAGFGVTRILSVGDNARDITIALSFLLAAADAVLVTGGLGPTFDDITRSAVAGFFHRPLSFSEHHFARFKRYFRKRRRPMHTEVRREAYFPRGAAIFDNAYGIAPGFGVPANGKWVIVMPGVPKEMEGMYRDEIEPFLARHFPPKGIHGTLVCKVLLLSEVEVLRRLKPFPPEDSSIRCGIYPAAGELLLNMTFHCRTRAALGHQIKLWKGRLNRKLKGLVSAFSEEPLEETVVKLALRRGITVALCESVTGGLIAKRLTDIVGASRVVNGAIVAYTDNVKLQTVGVPVAVLRKYSAVSRPSARHSCELIRQKFGSSLGLSTTGFAGPSGARGIPPGTIFIGLALDGKTQVRKCFFGGNRERIRWMASQMALAMLWEKLRG